jgi:hypothetical protein
MEREKTVVLNVRLTEPQADWLRGRAAAHHGGNLSAAARQALTDAWMFARCREDYRRLRDEQGFRFPVWPATGEGSFLEFALRFGGDGATWSEGDEEVL